MAFAASAIRAGSASRNMTRRMRSTMVAFSRLPCRTISRSTGANGRMSARRGSAASSLRTVSESFPGCILTAYHAGAFPRMAAATLRRTSSRSVSAERRSTLCSANPSGTSGHTAAMADAGMPHSLAARIHNSVAIDAPNDSASRPQLRRSS